MGVGAASVTDEDGSVRAGAMVDVFLEKASGGDVNLYTAGTQQERKKERKKKKRALS